MNRPNRRKVLECGGKRMRDTAFKQRLTYETTLQQRTEAVSLPPHSRTQARNGRFTVTTQSPTFTA